MTRINRLLGTAISAILLLSGTTVSSQPASSPDGPARTLDAEKPEPAEKPKEEKEAAKDPEDCHGPLYYRLKEQAEKRREADNARKEIAALSEKWGKIVWKGHNQEVREAHKKHTQRYRKCLKRKLRPTFLCTAIGQNRVSLCDGAIKTEEVALCKLVLNIHRAVHNQDATICEDVEPADVATICRFVVAGEFHCDDIRNDESRVFCQAIERGHQDWKVPTGVPPEVAAPVAWLLAARTGEEKHCRRLPFSKEAEACKALVAQTTEVCDKVRPTVETIDEDYSCRDIVMKVRTHELEDRTEVFAILGASFTGKGSCEIKLHLKRDGEPVVRTVETLEVENGRHVVRRYLLESEEFVSVRGNCTWDPETVVFMLDEPQESVDRW